MTNEKSQLTLYKCKEPAECKDWFQWNTQFDARLGLSCFSKAKKKTPMQNQPTFKYKMSQIWAHGEKHEEKMEKKEIYCFHRILFTYIG